jgi:hypothetical protein
MTLWTMTDIAGTYRAASRLIPFGTSRGGDILQGTVAQRTVRRLSLYLVLHEVVRPIPIAI